MNSIQPVPSEIDNVRFESALMLIPGNPVSRLNSKKHEDDSTLDTLSLNSSKSLRLLQPIDDPCLSPASILQLVNNCQYLRELSIVYSLLCDKVLLGLSANRNILLDTVRIEAHPEAKPLDIVSKETWNSFSKSLPQVKLILSSYLAEEEDYDSLIAPYVPLTHLYLGEYVPTAAIDRISKNCPRLVELVIGAYGPGLIDQILISIAAGCPKLKALGLGDCELTCSAFVEFVERCNERLQVLYVWETSLLEDSELDITELSARISLLLGRTWVPEYVPLW